MLTKSDPSPSKTGSRPDSFMGPTGKVEFIVRIVQRITQASVFCRFIR
jgi:hypothetical protein